MHHHIRCASGSNYGISKLSNLAKLSCEDHLVTRQISWINFSWNPETNFFSPSPRWSQFWMEWEWVCTPHGQDSFLEAHANAIDSPIQCDNHCFDSVALETDKQLLCKSEMTSSIQISMQSLDWAYRMQCWLWVWRSKPSVMTFALNEVESTLGTYHHLSCSLAIQSSLPNSIQAVYIDSVRQNRPLSYHMLKRVKVPSWMRAHFNSAVCNGS